MYGSTKMIIQTVYKPEENVDYLEEWLLHHINIGVTHFYMYDNSGGIEQRLVNEYGVSPLKLTKFNKHQIQFNYSLEESRQKQKQIIKKYPVTVIKWQKKNSNGDVIYAQNESIMHFANHIKQGLCAFIDIDEFIIKNEEFCESRLQQHKYKSRFFFNLVAECHERVPLIYTENWNPKAIIDMGNFPRHFEDIHFRNISLPGTTNFFNHYNHSEISHTAFDHDHNKNYGKFKDVPYEKIFEYVENTGLLKTF